MPCWIEQTKGELYNNVQKIKKTYLDKTVYTNGKRVNKPMYQDATNQAYFELVDLLYQNRPSYKEYFPHLASGHANMSYMILSWLPHAILTVWSDGSQSQAYTKCNRLNSQSPNTQYQVYYEY